MSVPTLVQSVASKDGSSVTSHPTGTLGATPTQGNLLVLARIIQHNPENFSTDPIPNIDCYAQDIVSSVFTVILSHKVAGASESTSYTTITTGPCFIGQKLMEFSGIDTITPFRTQVAGANSSGAGPALCGSLTPVTGELLIALLGTNSWGAGNPDGTADGINNSYTLVNDNAQAGLVVGYKVAPNTSALNPSVSWSPNTCSYVSFHAAFNAASNPASDRQIPRGLFRGLVRGVS